MAFTTQLLVAACLVGAVAARSTTSQTVQGWTVPGNWQQGRDFVVVKATDGSASKYAGYIFPGTNAQASETSTSYVSANGYYCEAKVLAPSVGPA